MFLQQHGVSRHFHRILLGYLDQICSNRWIGRRWTHAWPARSPDLNLLDYFLWGRMKDLVYAEIINDREALVRIIFIAIAKIQGSSQLQLQINCCSKD